ncbi:hypothetical protein [Pseudoxanthomonas sacheonensis]|uniref:hypothetical protein n=1 Tax=Pseudoxanthomonas sacheonensis TaxID=443615 RepID=UPI0013D632A5|nr:hypothetical protein [Pseudoxanthomonas sacheonensis]
MTIKDGHDPWALEVGRFVLAFGGIEHTAILMLRLLPEYGDSPPLPPLSGSG